jgi:hypothetical protein
MNTSTSWFKFILTVVCYLATVMVDDKIEDDEGMHLRHWPFQWPWRCTGAIQMALLMQHVLGYLGSQWTLPLGDTCSVLPRRPPGQQANKQQ